MRIVRKISAILLIITIVLSLQLLPAQAANALPTGSIKTSGVNLRSGAGTTYSVVATMSKGTKVVLLSCKRYNTNWYHIKVKTTKKKGYVHKDYLKINSNQLYIPTAATGYKGYTVKYTNVLNTTGKTISWSSSDTSIATIDKNGKATCKKAGSVTITAKAGDKKLTSKLTVKKADVTLNKTSLTLYKGGDTAKLTATCAKAVTWTSSNTSVATVSNGTITPKELGTTTIKAASKSGSATCKVTVEKLTITLSVTKSTMYVGNYAIITPSGGKSGYTYSSNNTSVITVNSKGIVNAKATGTATVTVKSGSLTKTKKFTVKSGSNITLSHTTSTLYATKTLYIKSTTGGVKWKTSNKAVATVNNGYVYGAKKGYAVISAYTSSGCKDCLVTVKAAEPVRFVYTSENSVLLNNTVKAIAITDKVRSNVKFKLKSPSGKIIWIKKPSKTVSSKRITWKATSKKMTEAGVYDIIAYARTKSNSSYKTGAGGKSTFYVSKCTSRATTGYSQRRATTSLLKNIASFEGYLSKVTPDALVADSPTVGYGKVVYPGDTFYNGMTKSEAFAYLTKTVNESGFTSRVNKLLTDNKIKFNQTQFDALVDFSYNLGAYAIELDSSFMSMLKNTYGKDSYKLTGYIRVTSAPLKKSASSSSTTLKNIKAGTVVTLVSDTSTSGYYKVKYSSKTGYVKTSQIVRRTTSTTVRDLKNTSYSKLKSIILPYHHASGTCYWGLLYRRIDEVEMYYFRDYTVDGVNNDYKMKYYCSRNSSFGMG